MAVQNALAMMIAKYNIIGCTYLDERREDQGQPPPPPLQTVVDNNNFLCIVGIGRVSMYDS